MATKKTAAKKTATKKATTRKPRVKVTLSVNEYDIPMLEITSKPRNTYISVKKAVAILANEGEFAKEEKYGRTLNRVSYGDGKSFLVGDSKVEAVTKNKADIEKAIA